MKLQLLLVHLLLYTINSFDVVRPATTISIQSKLDDAVVVGREKNDKNGKILSRHKRYMIFPVGSSFSTAVCSTIGIYGNPHYSLVSWGLNWGFAYELPTNVTYYKGKKNSREKRSNCETKPMMKRRYRRDLYQNLEIIMDQMGYDGRTCILRALCESSKVFGKRGKNLIAELIRTIFTFPKSKVLPFEPSHPALLVYDEAHRRGRRDDEIDCGLKYSQCGFSLIELALGKFSQNFKHFM